MSSPISAKFPFSAITGGHAAGRRRHRSSGARGGFTNCGALFSFAAAKQLGWQTIEANLVTLDALGAELAEIDENLIRNELTALQQALSLAERKEIYEALHSETKKGVAGGKAGGRGRKTTATAKISFAIDTAKKTSKTARTIRHKSQIGKAASTQGASEHDIARFLVFVDKPLREVRLGDVQAFVDSLSALAPATIGHYLHARPTESSSKYLAV